MDSLDSVKNVVLVLSGKGGVGKSTLSVQIALGLARAGHAVGLLDVDLCGPSIPAMLNISHHDVHQCEQGWVPVRTDQYNNNISVMSIAFLLESKNHPVIWRGPKKSAMIKQFIGEVCWGKLDFLVIDTPPGTSDEHLSVAELLRNKITGAVLVTTPQFVAVGDVRRELTFCRKAGISVYGVVENMSGYVCPHCSECSNIFSSGGGENLATMENLNFLGRIPIDPTLTRRLDSGDAFSDAFSNSQTRDAIDNIVVHVVNSELTAT